MNKVVEYSFKRNIILYTVVFITVTIILNISLSLVSNNITSLKVEEETNEFLLLTTALIEDNDLQVAFKYIENYSESHSVEVRILTDRELFSSVIDEFNYTEHTIETSKGDFIVQIDNSHSITVDFYQKNIFTINAIVVLVYLVSFFVIFFSHRNTSKHVEQDLAQIKAIINENPNYYYEFHFKQFDSIHKEIWNYLSEIDLLKDHKEMNMKGLAHDIKTPLTIIYNFILKSDIEGKEHAIERVNEINTLINDLIDENYTQSFREINMSLKMNNTINKYKDVFKTKDIKIDLEEIKPFKVYWSKRDCERVLENIFSNAFYYSDASSTFDIKIENKKLTFTSSGNPIPEDALTHILDKGFRGENAKEKNTDGKGLGLYICKLLLTPINADINVSVDGNKTTFVIQFK